MISENVMFLAYKHELGTQGPGTIWARNPGAVTRGTVHRRREPELSRDGYGHAQPHKPLKHNNV